MTWWPTSSSYWGHMSISPRSSRKSERSTSKSTCLPASTKESGNKRHLILMVAKDHSYLLIPVTNPKHLSLWLQRYAFQQIGKIANSIESPFLWIHNFTLKMVQAWPTWSARLFSIFWKTLALFFGSETTHRAQVHCYFAIDGTLATFTPLT